ncbi:MAG: two-component system response regulator [Gammaproteobacteria bacterium HGW-Gammaproteobacteria-14]|nr:MAG: two-component system response regulator [Gammaproteobacteria bacterium HGW-Gammaproteobacteria-14]
MNTITKPTILFVDDEERILRSLVMAFRAHYRVLSATEGHQALEMLANEDIDVLISDQRMPRMSGVEVLRGARDISPATMRILLTGYSDLAGIVGSINDGEIFRYVQKPWRLEELRDTIAEAAAVAQSSRSNTVATAVGVIPAHAAIIVLDRSPELAMVLKDSPLASRVRRAHTLEQAMTVMASEPVALLITDISLNGEDISPSLGVLKQQQPDLVTVVVTAFQDTGHLIRLINQAQVYRVLPRPTGRNMFLRSVESALKHHDLLKKRPAMLRRHSVEKSRDESLVSRIRNYLDRVRDPAAPVQG